MSLYRMHEAKDNLLFRMAIILHGLGFTPNIMTALGLFFGIASGLLFSFRAFSYAFTFGFLSVFCDMLDGTIARKLHLETKFGKVFDSVADRSAEFAVVIGALVGGIIETLGFVAILGSVSLLKFGKVF